MNESFSSRVNVHELIAAAREHEGDGPHHPAFVNVTIDDHGSLTIAPDPIKTTTLENIPAP